MNTRLIRTPGLYLVGFMACGKSTIGAALAGELGWEFADLDHDIESEASRKIVEIFETDGEDEFRRLEHEALRARVRRIQHGQPTVLSLGGGAFTQHANHELMRDNGITIWLDAPLEMLQRRVAGQNHRPLARDPERFAWLYREREQSYSRADYRIDIRSDDPAVAVEAVLVLPIF